MRKLITKQEKKEAHNQRKNRKLARSIKRESE